jgi:hypothetical protein
MKIINYYGSVEVGSEELFGHAFVTEETDSQQNVYIVFSCR